MNVRNESFPSSDHLLKEPGVPLQKHDVLRPEEVQMYKECTYDMYFKAGLPFAIFCQMMSSAFKAPKKVEMTLQVLGKKGLIFFGNIILGTILFSPICYNKLLVMRAEFEKKNKELQGEESLLRSEGTQPVTQPEDFSYPTDIVTTLNEPESNFSMDFTTSKFVSDDLETIKAPSTTYQDLRDRNRSTSSTGNRGPPPNLEPELRLGTYPPPVEKPVFVEPPQPQRIVKKNKYGDEME